MRHSLVYDVVTTLIGPIEPVGESHTDAQRAKNLAEILSVTGMLLDDINEIRRLNIDRPEASMKAMGLVCDEFINNLPNLISN